MQDQEGCVPLNVLGRPTIEPGAHSRQRRNMKYPAASLKLKGSQSTGFVANSEKKTKNVSGLGVI